MDQGAPRTSSCLQCHEEPCGQVPSSQTESLSPPASCLCCFLDPRQLPSRHLHSSLCTDLHQGCRQSTTCHPWVHTGTKQRTSGILLPHCQPVLRCDHNRTTRSPRAYQPAPAQREKLLSSPPSLHMEMRAAGTAQRALPVVARPGVASSRLTGITLGALQVKDQRHSG